MSLTYQHNTTDLNDILNRSSANDTFLGNINEKARMLLKHLSGNYSIVETEDKEVPVREDTGSLIEYMDITTLSTERKLDDLNNIVHTLAVAVGFIFP